MVLSPSHKGFMQTAGLCHFIFHRDRKPFPFIPNVGERQSSLDLYLTILTDKALGSSRNRGPQLKTLQREAAAAETVVPAFSIFPNLVPFGFIFDVSLPEPLGRLSQLYQQKQRWSARPPHHCLSAWEGILSGHQEQNPQRQTGPLFSRRVS